MMRIFYKTITFVLLFLIGFNLQAQYTSKKVRDVHKAYTDSLKNVEYNYYFPILGQGAYSEGYDIPYPFGIMANYFWSSQGITVNNLQLGYKNAYNEGNSFELRPVLDDEGNEILGFGDNTNVSYSYNVRPDLWVFPFLDVYGIFGYGRSHTEIEINRLGNTILDVPFKPEPVDQGIRTAGVGLLAAGGVGPVWISGDFNFTWNKPELTTNTTFVKVMGLRMGHVMKFKKSPDKNISIWVGAMRVKMQSETLGEISVNQVFELDNKDKIVNEYRDWYNNDATPGQKLVADKVLTPIIDELDKREGESIVEYGIDKKAVQEWNMLVGAQYQFNKHWQLRCEGGIIGDRKSFLVSLNYRFLGLKRKSS